MKSKQLKYKYLWVAFFVFVTILIGGILYVKNKEVVNESSNQISTTPTEVQYPVDNANDGVYKNNKYGFEFRYPRGIFENRPTNSAADKLGVIKHEWFKNPPSNELFMSVVVMPETLSEDYYPEYEQLFNINDDKGIGIPNINFHQKINKADVNGHKVIAYYSELDHSTETKSIIYSYRLAWRENDTLFIVSVNSDSKNVLTTSKYVFDTIFQSLSLSE